MNTVQKTGANQPIDPWACPSGLKNGGVKTASGTDTPQSPVYSAKKKRQGSNLETHREVAEIQSDEESRGNQSGDESDGEGKKKSQAEKPDADRREGGDEPSKSIQSQSYRSMLASFGIGCAQTGINTGLRVSSSLFGGPKSTEESLKLITAEGDRIKAIFEQRIAQLNQLVTENVVQPLNERVVAPVRSASAAAQERYTMEFNLGKRAGGVYTGHIFAEAKRDHPLAFSFLMDNAKAKKIDLTSVQSIQNIVTILQSATTSTTTLAVDAITACLEAASPQIRKVPVVGTKTVDTAEKVYTSASATVTGIMATFEAR